ncbi:MAG TPA: undecaprenyl-diphosphate phosphatase [Candidatus Mediterraneibacter merdigallinarum]|nr:undecaprenyl-diphosphate phosphatase [Candidatus Mediterraneibacter merdigallinarum]
MEFFKAVIFGIVEGITEWLPVSSTGHMIILDEFVRLKGSDSFINVFLVVIQLGAILAVVVLFWNRLFPFQFRDREKPVIEKDKMVLWGKILLACIPAAVIGVLFDSTFEALFYHAVPVAIALIVFGVAFILIERWKRGKPDKITSVDQLTVSAVLIIGVFQVIAAVFPGTSRSGATIVGALLIGVSRTVAAEFTFYLAVPVMLGASLLRVLQYGFAFTGTELMVLGVGMVTAFLISLAVVRFQMDYVKKHDFQIFGWYRIALGAVVILLNVLGVLQV